MILAAVPKPSYVKPVILWQGPFLDGKMVIVQKAVLSKHIVEIYCKIESYDYAYETGGELDVTMPNALDTLLDVIGTDYCQCVMNDRNNQHLPCTDCGEIHGTEAIIH